LSETSATTAVDENWPSSGRRVDGAGVATGAGDAG
jgi:hypothetical protein